MKSNNMERRILVGDIGGTKTELAIVTEGNFFERIEKFLSKEFNSLEEIMFKFLKDEQIDVACFGVAGPVINEKCCVTNLPWIIESQRIAKQFNIQTVLLINDLEASAYGISGVSKDQLYTINEGILSEGGNQVLISPGTGLGEAILVYHDHKYISVASEGGHSDFAPRNEKEIELFRYFKRKFPHVSYECILSGNGISDLYSFLSGGEKKEPEEITKENSNRSKETLKWFCEILGAEAGNLALKGCARNGVYIGGGIPIKILDTLKEDDFMKGFLDKGRFSSFLKNVPVYLILDPHVSLFGALFSANYRKSQ